MNAKVHILQQFLRAGGGFVSGEALAGELELSRVSVWNHLEQLRKEGFGLTAIRNKGYRLDSIPDALHAELLAAFCANQPLPLFENIDVLGEVGSTNSEAEQRLSAGLPAPLAVAADAQSAGRGRRGRVWHSPAHRNLYVSVGLRPQLPPARLQTITLWTGMRLALWLRADAGLPVMVKWPNDLYLNGRKIAGILTEARVDAESTRELVIGTGLNVNLAAAEFPADLARSASSLHAEGLPRQPLTPLCHRFLLCLAEAIGSFLNDDFADELAHLWPSVDFLAGRRVVAGEVAGTVLGINAVGGLRVRRDDGFTAVLNSGEVSLHGNNFTEDVPAS